jgi:hypothetical protein
MIAHKSFSLFDINDLLLIISFLKIEIQTNLFTFQDNERLPAFELKVVKKALQKRFCIL